jgi:two-component system, sensor histidine kinase
MMSHLFAQMPIAIVFSAGGALVFGLTCYGAEAGFDVVTFGLAHLASGLVNLAAYRRFAGTRSVWAGAGFPGGAGRGEPLVIEDVQRARTARRIGALTTGLAWGLGGVFWPLTPLPGPGFVLVFCYAGIAAGATMTLAADPVAYGLAVYVALLPDFLSGLGQHHWWGSALILWFGVGTSFAMVRNHRALRESFNLRFENAELLQDTLRAHEAEGLARRFAERTADAKARFVAAASHDLRQPVQALSLFVDVLAGLADEQTARRRELIDAVARSTDALRAMLEELLDISRLDAGLTMAAPRRVALGPLLEEVLAGLRDECDARDMVMHVRGRPATVLVDAGLLARVLHNLGTNAVRHGGRGRVLVAIRHRRGACTIQFWDQGPGIPPADTERIFEDFVQLDNRERDRSRGLGLGLSIVRRICALHGWPLVLRSRVGHGSMFALTVGLAPNHHEPLRPSAPRGDAPSGLRIMLVEDDPLVRVAASAWLEAKGCVVWEASSGTEAITVLTEGAREGRRIDVLVTDQRLPGGLPGLELVARARASSGAERLPAVLLTGDVEENLGPRLVDGMVVLRKPVCGDGLWDAIQTVTTPR